MSHNQSRDAQLRKPARSGSGHHRGFGGRGAGAAGGYATPGDGGAAAANSVAHPPYPNRSFKKQGNGQGWQHRVNPANVDLGGGFAAPGRAVQNGVHPQSNSRVASEASGLQTVKQMEGTTSRISRPIPRPPPSQSAGGESTAPVKPTKGDSSSSFTLQFGSINAGFVHGMQIPARTSSAPPNLDEQKRDQARHNSLRAGTGPLLPLASAPKPQQQPKKDKADRNHPDLVNSYPQSHAKRENHIQMPAPSAMSAQNSSVPISGMSIPMFQQPQIPMKFGGPNHQVQPHNAAAASLQIPIPMSVGNPQQIQQQMFISNLPPHLMQSQGMMHQTQGLNFQIGHQLPSSMNPGIATNTQYGQQQAGMFNVPRKSAVKITHPDTHEELKLEKRPHPSLPPQSQPISSFPPHPMSYYPTMQSGPYGSGSPYFPAPSSNPLTNTQVIANSQPPRFNYPTARVVSTVTIVNPSTSNTLTVSKSGNPANGISETKSRPMQGGSEPANRGQTHSDGRVPVSSSSSAVTIKNADVMISSKKEDTSLESDSGFSNNEVIKTTKPLGEVASSSRITDARSESTGQQPEINLEKPDDTNKSERMQSGGPLCTLSTEIEDKESNSTREKSESLRDHNGNLAKTETHSQEKQLLVEGSLASPVMKQASETYSQGQAYSESSELPTSTLIFSPITDQNVSSEAGSCESKESNDVPASMEIPVGSLNETVSSTERASQSESAETLSSSDAAKLCPKSEISKIVFPELAEVEQRQEHRDPVKFEIPNTITDISKNSRNNEEFTLPNVSESLQDENGSGVSPEQSLAVENLVEDVIGSDTGTKCKSSEDEAASGVSDCNRTKVEDTITSSPEGDIAPSSDAPVDLDVIPSMDSYPNKNENLSHQEVPSTQYPNELPIELETSSVADSSDTTKKDQGKVDDHPTVDSVVVTPASKDTSHAEVARIKTPTGKKKKKKELLLKADAAGTNSDLYMAYKGPEEKADAVITSESNQSQIAVDMIQENDDAEKKDAAVEEDVQSKSELEDWEDAADLSTPKLRTSENLQPTDGAKKLDDSKSGSMSKKYSRDFLFTLSDHCTDLPSGFEFGSDIADALMNIQVGLSHNRQFSSSARIIDRPTGSNRIDHRAVNAMDNDRWSKAPNTFASVRDLPSDVLHGRPNQGVNHGVLRNPRGPSGGILSGPLQSAGGHGGTPRGNVEADRWQRATGVQRGLMHPPQTPLQVMHKAEKKYQIGKVSDEEEAKQRQLKSILNKLTPQNFERLFQQVKEVNIDNVATLVGVISQIFDKALTEPTFCEMYADFCAHLSGALPDFSSDNEKITFKRLLLNKCQEEFERGEKEEAEANRVEEEGELKQNAQEREQKKLLARRRMLGNIRLIGELYKKKMLTERIMHECIQKLLGQHQNPDEEDIEALCKLMSTIGVMIDHPKVKEQMDVYFDIMSKLSTNQKFSSRVRFMLKDSIDLRLNKWQQRRKVEGPKKIDEVHRDAVQERQAQASRLTRGPGISSSARRAPPVDYSHRSNFSSSSGSQQLGNIRSLHTQIRGHGAQDFRLEDRHPSEGRVLSVPLPQRPSSAEAITLGPQGGLARGMSSRGQPLMPIPAADLSSNTGESRRAAPSSNGYGSVSDRSASHLVRDDSISRHLSDRSIVMPDRSNSRDPNSYIGSRHVIRASDSSSAIAANPMPGSTVGSQNAAPRVSHSSEEYLQKKSMSAIQEYYSAKDVNEVALCIQELSSPDFYPSMISLWVLDSFEKKDVERNLLSDLLVNLSKVHSFIGGVQLIRGFESVLTSLEDAVSDAPRAPEFLGRLFGRLISENLIRFGDVGELICNGGEEPGSLVETGLAADVVGSILEYIKSEKGASFLKKMCSSPSIQLDNFRPPQPLKSRRLEAFLQG